MSFDEIADLQGWSDITQLIILRDFVSKCGLQEELDRFAQERADFENEYSCSDGDIGQD